MSGGARVMRMQTHARAICGVVFGLLLAVCAWAGDFEAANEDYDQGRFAEAQKAYAQVIASGTRSANLFLNVGNAEYRLGSSGRAILNYTRALALEPGHAEARANLGLVREQTRASAIEEPIVSRGVRWLPANVWAILGAVAAWVLLFCGVGICIGARRLRGGLMCVAATALVVVACAIFALRLQVRDGALAIVTAKEVEAHLAPAKSAALAGVFPAGSEVRVLSERGPWTYCELPGARRGWVEAGSIEKIEPSHL